MPVPGAEVVHPSSLTYPRQCIQETQGMFILTSFYNTNFAGPRSEAGVGFPATDPYQWKPEQVPVTQTLRQLFLQCLADLKSVYSIWKQNDLFIQGLCI